MYLEIEFEEQDQSFDLEFEQVTEISDGGYERGYAEGYEQGNTDGYTTGKTEGVTEGFADALAKRTELVVTESGEYEPTGESTGFKKVTVGIQKGEDLDAVIAEQAELIEELSATLDEKIGAYDVGYDAALEKLTDLVVTENGDYTPPEGSTGFKSVSVNVQAEGAGRLGQFWGKTITEITEEDFGSVRALESEIFRGQKSLVSIKVPGIITKIGTHAFRECSALKYVELGECYNVLLGSYAFKDCSSLENLTIPEGVLYHNNNCFDGCTQLKTLTFPSTYATMSSAFANCTSLHTIIVKKTTPPTMNYANAFSQCTALTKIAVPIGSGDAYKAATNWSTYADIIVEEAM